MKSKKPRMIYLIGALRNRGVMDIANKLRKDLPGVEVFDNWISPGPEADGYLKEYCKKKGCNYKETLNDWAAKHVFEFDKFHLDRATDVVMCMECGRSCHLELGYAIGSGKRGYVLFDKEPDRVDVMYNFTNSVHFSYNELVKELRRYK